MVVRMDVKLGQLKVHLHIKFEDQNQSEITREVCSSIFKNVEKIVDKQLIKQNNKIGNLDLLQNLDEVEQYEIKFCLRTEGFPVKNNKKAPTSGPFLLQIVNCF